MTRPSVRRLAAILVLSLVTNQRPGRAQEAAYGSRLAPLPAGEGGDLLLTAPSELCADATYDLQVRRTDQDGGMLWVLKGPAGPSRCEWQIDSVREGVYDAVIVRHADGVIVATSGTSSLVRGGTAVIALKPAIIEIEGRITVNGKAPGDAMLHFAPNTANRWNVPLDVDGNYRVKLEGADSGYVCISLMHARTQSIGAFHIGCRTFDPMLQRFDADVSMRPGVVRVQVAPLPPGPKGDWTSLSIYLRHDEFSAGSAGFRATEGFVGEYFDGKLQEYEVSVETTPSHRVVARSRVTLSAERPLQVVRLVIPPDTLTCDEGWWSAC